MLLLMRVLTGSRLYGTHRPDSDWDYYEIYDKINSYHKVIDGNDVQQWSLSMLMRVADKGGHNALDVLFAPDGWPEVDLLREMRLSYRANPALCTPRFRATQKSFLERGDEKGRLHAERLESNLSDIMSTGRYNPRWKI